MPDANAPAISLREARPADRAALEALNGELQAFEARLRPSRVAPELIPARYLDELLKRRNADDCGIIVALHLKQVIGFIAYYASEDVLEAEPSEVIISDLVVATEHRQKGIGKALVAEVVNRAKVMGIGRVVVATLSTNRQAQKAYEALGFRPFMTTMELVEGQISS